MSELKIKLAAGTNVGLIRQNNEDNFVVCSDLSSSEWLIPQVDDYADLGEYGALLVVADGMGGANAGEVASAITVETIQECFVPDRLKNVIADDKDIQEFMKAVVKQADVNILNRSKEDSSTQGMGTTVVMAWIVGRRAYICWCGDSRCYVLNKQKGLVQLSKDHSYVQELVDKGELNRELMHDHPLSNVITRCLGAEENRADPDTIVYELHDGDTIMLCSDGLSSLCHDDQIQDTMVEFREKTTECKNELISAALNNGGYDNVTIAVCNVQMEGEETVADKEETDKKAPQDEKPEEEEEEELSNTIRTEAVRHGMKPWKKVCLLLLILAIAAATYIALADNCQQLRSDILKTITPYIEQIKNWVKQ